MTAENHKSPRSGPEHDKSVEALIRRDAAAMLELALNSATPPEMLVILSQAKESNIRAAVAGNPATPSAVNQSLVNDDDPMVRAALGARLAALLPEINAGEHQKLAARATAILTRLADDANVAVRRILAEEICRLDGVPKDLVITLARDIDELVAVPVCQFSPVLDDADLIGLVSSPGNPAALAAIARREDLGAQVSDTLVQTGNVDAISALLGNKSAQIRENTLNRIIDRAQTVPTWHEALCARPEITSQLAMKLAGFVATKLIEQLAARADLDADTIDRLGRKVTEALARDTSAASRDDATIAIPTEADIRAAIDKRHQSQVIRLIAARADVGCNTIRRIFAARVAKTIVALAWKTGLTMETAEMLQHYPGFIPDRRIIECEDDNLFPMTENDMEWQLATFGLGATDGRTAADNEDPAPDA